MGGNGRYLYLVSAKRVIGDLKLFEPITIWAPVTLRYPAGDRYPSLLCLTWIAVDDVTYRLQDGLSRLERHHQADNSAQFTRILADSWAWIANSEMMPPYAR
jgi:hypothetical protein